MPCARRTSIAPPPPLRQGGLNRRLRRWLVHQLRQLQPAVGISAAACGAEHYRKHFTAFQHACLLLYHGLAASPSLRQSYDTVVDCHGLVTLAALVVAGDAERLTVSFSQYAASNTSRPAAFLSGLLPTFVAQVRQGPRLGVPGLPATVQIIDATVLHLSVKLAPWLAQKSGWRIPTGVRLQTRYSPAWDLPEQVVVSGATNDYGGLSALLLDDPVRLAELRDHTLVVDLGYYSHRRFAHLMAAGVHWVTRRLPSATLQVVADAPVQATLPTLAEPRITVLADQQVTLGSPHNRAGAVLPHVRLVRARVAPLPAARRLGQQPVVYEVLTDRWDLTAADVVQVYLWRWQIELFFRWLKSHVQLTQLLGYSQNAVELSVALAIIVHLLTLIAAQALGLTRRSPSLLRRLAWTLAGLRADEMTADATAALQLALLDLTPVPPD